MSKQPLESIKQQGKSPHRANILAARIVANTIKSTLGPKGMDKVLVDSSNNITISNDGATILSEIAVEHPIARMMIEIAQTQEQEVGDGTTTAVVLAGELLKNAEALLDNKIHPTIIAKGYRHALDLSLAYLNKRAVTLDTRNTRHLLQIAKTAITGKAADSNKEQLAQACVVIISQLLENNKKIENKYISIQKHIGDQTAKASIIQGVTLEKKRVHQSMPTKVNQPKIALLTQSLEVKSTDTKSQIQITSPKDMQQYVLQEEQMLEQMVAKIANSGANVVCCLKGIDEYAQHLLAKKGILALRRLTTSELEVLSDATGATIIGSVDDLHQSSLGTCGRITSEEHTRFSELTTPSYCTLVISGHTSHIVAEIERAVDDALGDLKTAVEDKRIVGGAGSCELLIANHLKSQAQSMQGREKLAVEAFAKALETLPQTLAENAGLDPIDMLTQAMAALKEDAWMGIDVYTGKPVDAVSQGIIEPLSLKTKALSSATEVANVILRIDDIIFCGPIDDPRDAKPPQ